MFESLITSYPRRTDLWSVYVDMLVKVGHLDQARYAGHVYTCSLYMYVHTPEVGWTNILSCLPGSGSM